MTSKPHQFRMDFVQKIISIDEKSRKVTFALEPDPRRYEWKEINGEKRLYDKFDDVYFSEQCYFDMAKQMIGKPINYQPQEIGDAEVYIKSRRPLIASMLDGHDASPVFKDKSEEFLQSLETDKLAFVIISLDIVGSTNLATNTDERTYARIISTILFELSEIIPNFHGHVLKYTGDGLIAYFPEPSFITKNDLAIDCALTLRGIVYNALNLILQERGMPTIDIRIGLDAGEACVVVIGSPETKRHKDIIGAVVSLAAKIQKMADPGGIYLGDTVNRNLHTMWRETCELVSLPKEWVYKDSSGNIYNVHRIKFIMKNKEAEA